MTDTEHHEEEFEKADGRYGIDDEFVAEVAELVHTEEWPHLRLLVAPLHPADMAELLALLGREDREALIQHTMEDFDAETVTYLEGDLREEVLDLLGAERAAQAIASLDTDDAVEVMEDLDHEDRQEILQAISEQSRADLEEGLSYPERSAGRLMSKRVVAVPEFWTVGDAIDYLRRATGLPQDFYEIFVVDPRYKPVGGLVLSRIMTAERAIRIQDIMETEIRALPTDMDQEDVADIFRKYGLVSAPVVSEEGRLMGVVTVDDIVHIIQEEAQDDFMKLGGVSEKGSYTTVRRTVERRFPWLFVNLLLAFSISMCISLFEDSIAGLVALAALMPMVAGMGGNAGTQSLTTAVRALAMNELGPSNIARVVGKEALTAMTNGLLLAVVTGAAIYLRYHDPKLCLVFGAALVLNFVIAGLAGALIPFVLDRLDADPAVASGVFLTALTDLCGFMIFLGLATALLL